MPNGSFLDLVSGFDNHVRNAGAGQEYEKRLKEEQDKGTFDKK